MKSIFLLVIFIIGFVSHSQARIVMRMGGRGSGTSHGETWYLGSNEKAMQYNKHGPGGDVDDGLFIAIPDGGSYAGYSYFEIRHPRSGTIDGAAAHLPPNPGSLAVTAHYRVACTSPWVPPAPGALRISGRGQIPELPDKSLIPIGSRFFFWISGGGRFQLSTSIIKTLPSKTITVTSKSHPKPQYAIWFDDSDTKTRTFTLIEE